jgi:hypothetical protein
MIGRMVSRRTDVLGRLHSPFLSWDVCSSQIVLSEWNNPLSSHYIFMNFNEKWLLTLLQAQSN